MGLLASGALARLAAAVVLAAGLTVLLATRLGFPISTTHALLGGLVGAGLVMSPTGINGTRLAGGFLLPLLLSPLLAIVSSGLLYPVLRFARQRFGVTQETCVCVGGEIVHVVPGAPGAAQAMLAVGLPEVTVRHDTMCRIRYRGDILGVSARRLLDIAHYFSAGAVSFARGLNDTPKIAAMLLVTPSFPPGVAVVGVGVVMAAGGWISARRVAETMSHGVTEMNPGQGLAANVVTSLLVIGASGLGMPVSTTHVSCGSLFGIGTVTKQARWKTIGNILLAWVITLPVAGALAALAATALRSMS